MTTSDLNAYFTAAVAVVNQMIQNTKDFDVKSQENRTQVGYAVTEIIRALAEGAKAINPEKKESPEPPAAEL